MTGPTDEEDLQLEPIQEPEPKLVKSLRISIPLSEGENNVFNFSKVQAQHLEKLGPETTTSVIDIVDSDEDQEVVESVIGKRKAAARKVDPELEYDLNDDFIDDSEFYLAENVVEPPAVAAAKPRRKKEATVSTAVAVVDKEPKQPKKRGPKPKEVAPAVEEIKKKKPGRKPSNTPPPQLPGPVLVKLDQFRKKAEKESFEGPDGKKMFPPHLKPLLNELAITAMDCQSLGGPFFQHLTQILPFNTFTLRKLISRTTYPDRLRDLKLKIPTMYAQFEKDIDEQVQLIKQQDPTNSRFRWNMKLKYQFWNLLCIEELNKEEPQYAENNMSTFWPQGWMETTALSMIYSQVKKSLSEKQGQVPFEKEGLTVRVDPFSPAQVRQRKNQEEETPKKEKRRASGMGSEPKKTKRETLEQALLTLKREIERLQTSVREQEQLGNFIKDYGDRTKALQCEQALVDIQTAQANNALPKEESIQVLNPYFVNGSFQWDFEPPYWLVLN
ncbi:hypothetical protein EDD86DRAFT_246922 [Gorgonomyces haynaldii]|nr:hypothetical protein EDD86DRAFT_246922 [Gorgonomyces haynaldii]